MDPKIKIRIETLLKTIRPTNMFSTGDNAIASHPARRRLC